MDVGGGVMVWPLVKKNACLRSTKDLLCRVGTKLIGTRRYQTFSSIVIHVLYKLVYVLCNKIRF